MIWMRYNNALIFAIAICIFEKYKDNPKEGMKVAIDIMLNVNEENEKEIIIGLQGK